MKIKDKIKVIATVLTASVGFSAIADGELYENTSDWTPYTFNSSISTSDSTSESLSSRMIPLYSQNESNGVGSIKSDALSFGIEDSSDGLWKFSLDVNQPQEDLFGAEQYRVHAAYSPSGDNSTFYINYGNRRVPVSIKVDDLFNYEQPNLSSQGVSLGLEQMLNEHWAVSISYTKSELKQRSHSDRLFGDTQSAAINQKYWFDLNRDGLPESVSLFSELGATEDFSKAFEGIEIKLSRQVNDTLSIGGIVSKTDSNYDWQPFQFKEFGHSQSELNEASVSIFSQLELSSEWSMGAQLKHQSYQQTPTPIVSLVSDKVNAINFDSTTLDIGVQYQGRWDDVGLVIRIDLVNLLGGTREQHSEYEFNDTGLAPYTFETPKYIKLSGSINF